MFYKRNIKFVSKTNTVGSDNRSFKGSQVETYTYCQETIKFGVPKLTSYDHVCLSCFVLCK